MKPEAKTSSLRSVRVKPDRQKDKQLQSEKDNVVTNNNNNNNENWQSPLKTSDINDFKSTVEKLVIKTESMTVKTELSTVITQTHPVKIEYQTVKSVKSESDDNKNAEITYENKNIPVTISVKIETNLTTETNPVKLEDSSIKIENTSVPVKTELETKEMKIEMIPIPIKTEPDTSAVTPVAIKVPVSEVMSPVEGKENIPLIKSSENNLEIIEVPYRPKPIETIDLDNETYRNNFIHEIKKRKLDILKEGGLEVTPVRSAPSKDGRPSVIQHITPPIHFVPKPVKPEAMPPPTSVIPLKRTHITVPQTLVNITPTTPTKKPSTSFPFVNGTPPKVVQSRSIYSYSEKTVYGNPKDILSPMVHAPKFANSPSRLTTGGDPVDLSVNSPQKPVVEIMRMPQSSSSSSYNRDSVTKNLYKTNSSIMDGRRLGPNLEITLVGPNKNYPNTQKMYQPSSSSHIQHASAQKRLSADYFTPSSKITKEENGKYKSNKQNIEMNMFVNSSTSRQNQPNLKNFSNPNLTAFPPYLTQLYEQASKSLPPYLPFIDPTMYYTAAMQNLYSNNSLNSAPILPIPTAEQLKLYAELMAHGRMPYPFQLQQDNNKMKKP